MYKKLLLVIYFFIALGIFFIAGIAYAQDNRTIVGFKHNITETEISSQFNLGMENIKRIADTNNFLIITDKSIGGPDENPDIRFVEEDHIYSALLTPNDTFFSEQWGTTHIDAPSAWDLTTGSVFINIAVLDTGINGLHEDLSGRISAGYNFVNNIPILANTDSDNHGHGTQVAGVIGAIGNNNMGVAGINWVSPIIPIKVLDSNGNGYSSDIAQGIYYATSNGAKIINLSLGGQYPSTTIKDAIDYAIANGLLVIAATGNDGGSISYPAKYSEVIAVGATNDSNIRPSWSNYGAEIDIVAPGVSIATTKDSAAGNEYVLSTGTSLAAPFVSSVLSLMWSLYPDLNASGLESILKASAEKLSAMNGANFTNEYGYGLVDAYNALDPSYDINPAHYHHEWISQNANPSLDPSGAYQFSVSVKNTGSVAWKKGSVNLGTSEPTDRISSFLREGGTPTGWISSNRIEFSQDLVAPGDNATYTFWMKVPSGMNLGDYREYFRLVADGITWMENYGIFWNIHINSLADEYHYTISEQNAYPQTLMAGQSYNFILKIRNTSSATWDNNTVKLGTSNPSDSTPIFFRDDLVGYNPSGWLSTNRIEMEEESVAPGEIGTFSFWMTVPSNVAEGTYRQYVRPVADGITWMENYGIYWEIKVARPHSAWVAQSPNISIHQGDQAESWVEYRNTGSSSWIKDTYYPLRFGTSNPIDRSSIFHDDSWLGVNRINLDDASVSPGATGKFTFTINVPADTPVGTYKEYFRPVFDGFTWLEDYGVFWNVEVLPQEPI